MKTTVEILKLFADETRLRIIFLLSKKPMCVCELSKILGISQPAVTKILKAMKECSLIKQEKTKTWTENILSLTGLSEQIFENLKETLNKEKQIKEDYKTFKTLDRKHICNIKEKK